MTAPLLLHTDHVDGGGGRGGGSRAQTRLTGDIWIMLTSSKMDLSMVVLQGGASLRGVPVMSTNHSGRRKKETVSLLISEGID